MRLKKSKKKKKRKTDNDIIFTFYNQAQVSYDIR